jgi:predicted DNA-binding transcriptional regulator AlpA
MIMLSGGQESMNMKEQQNVFSEPQAANYLGVSAAVLRLWRSEGKGPRHFKAGEKLVRYRRADLDVWVEARLSNPEVGQ